MPSTPINGLPSPDDNSPNDPPIHFGALNAVLDSLLVPRFTTGTARDSAITAPVAGMLCAVGGQTQRYTGAYWRAIGLDPVGQTRTSGVAAAPVNAASTYSPPGVALTLPALPVGQIVVVECTTRFYVEDVGDPQNVELRLVPTGATRIWGDPNGGARASTSSLFDSVTTRANFQITAATPATFGTTYAAGAGARRIILQREDWTAWL